MSYKTIKDGIVGNLNALGYLEASQQFSFDGASAAEYGNTYILRPVSGQNEEGITETMSDRFNDVQEWDVMIAIKKSANSDPINLDDLHTRRDALVNRLDKPTNWSSYVRLQKYLSWSVEDANGYYFLTIKLKIVDQIVYL